MVRCCREIAICSRMLTSRVRFEEGGPEDETIYVGRETGIRYVAILNVRPIAYNTRENNSQFLTQHQI